jgi:sodium-dependent dicarboxylate transporter 2/3/5
LLFGGGITLAKAMESSGLIEVVAGLVAMHNLSPVFVYLVLIVSGLIFTELMSNVALATIYIPLVIGIAEGLGLNPLLLSVPVVIATSCAFMLPVATPPNAIVFSSGRIEMNQMVRAGFFLNLFSVGILMLAAFTMDEDPHYCSRSYKIL